MFLLTLLKFSILRNPAKILQGLIRDPFGGSDEIPTQWGIKFHGMQIWQKAKRNKMERKRERKQNTMRRKHQSKMPRDKKRRKSNILTQRTLQK